MTNRLIVAALLYSCGKFSFFLLTWTSWDLRSYLIAVGRNGTGLGYGVVIWSLGRLWVCCVGDCDEQKTKTQQKQIRVGKPLALNQNELFSAPARIIFIIFWYIFYTQRRLSLFASVKKRRWKPKKRKEEFANVCENTPISLSCRKKWAHIYISSSFSKHSDRHSQHWHIHGSVAHTHAFCTHTHVHTYNILTIHLGLAEWG